MLTEITDLTDCAGVLFYDADCRFCVRTVGRVRPLLTRCRIQLLPLQTAGCQDRLRLTEDELLAEMWFLRPDGKKFGGANALIEISGHFWWLWPLRQIARLPGIMSCLRSIYGWIARHRHCVNGACRVEKAGTVPVGKRPDIWFADLFPLLILPLLALSLRTRVPGWVFMWAMAFALYAGCKWLTYREAIRKGASPAPRRVLAYLLAWPGMGAADFLNQNAVPPRPRPSAWFAAGGKMVWGALLLWDVARMALPGHPLLAGWIGMTGAILVLHFGLFHLLALNWQRLGVKTTPLMDQPLLAESLAEFWGRRWNTAFNELVFRFTFRPLLRWTSPMTALLMVFGLSGLVHELVISLPAGGGYGLPTGYFLIQGLGILAERARLGKKIGLGQGLRGWLFTVLVTVGPVFWLFHPPFIKNIILPMLTAIGAT